MFVRFKVVKDADPEEAAYSKALPITIASAKSTPQNINLALHKGVEGSGGSSNEPLENAVDGTKATRYVAAVAGFPQWIIVDLGSIMEVLLFRNIYRV